MTRTARWCDRGSAGHTSGRRALRVLTVRDEDGALQTLRVTEEHPFFVRFGGWTPARSLEVGDTLLGADGTLTVVANAHEAHPRGVTVYNIEIEQAHTYFVLAAGANDAAAVWVHNSCEVANPKDGHRYPPGVAEAWDVSAAQSNWRKAVGNADSAVYTKHTKAVSVEDAVRLSSGGAAQYVPGVANEHLERLTLQKGFIVEHSNGFHAYAPFTETIGYANGTATQWIRAELSGGVIHGHPRPAALVPSAARAHFGM